MNTDHSPGEENGHLTEELTPKHPELRDGENTRNGAGSAMSSDVVSTKQD